MDYPTYKYELELKEEGYSFVAGVDEAGRGCEKYDAEVLTSNGWKYYTNISLNDKVLSYTSNGMIEWQSIDEIIEKDFDGDLIELKNRGIHISVTPDHYFDVLRRTFKRDKDGKLVLTGFKFRGRKSILDLKNNDYIPRGGNWKGHDEDYFVLPLIDKIKYDHSGKDYSKKNIPMKIWVAFMGIYLSEGSVTHSDNGAYVVSIKQLKGDNYLKIKELLNIMPFKVFEGTGCLVIRNKQLYTYLKQFGKCYDKYIPNDLKNLSPKLLNVLIDWLILGDGSCYQNNNRKKVCTYYTTSKKLKDDFEEILLKTGRTYHTTVREPRDTYINGRLIKKENCVHCFETRLRRNNKAHVKSLHKKLIPYKGKVFCLRLKKHHNFYVRRNGTGYFTGNCGAGPVVAGAVRIPDFYPSDFFDGYINDSKKMSSKKREEAFGLITDKCDFGIGVISNNIIDAINILEATKLAMKKAINDLISGTDYLLIDGTVKLSDMHCPQKQVIKGDAISISIAAASIIAKVHRDRIMLDLHKKYPVYGWDTNKGYLTKKHLEGIKLYGITEYHRESFRRVGR